MAEDSTRSFIERLLARSDRALDSFVGEDLRRDPEAARRARLVVVTAISLVFIDLIVLVVSDWGIWRTAGGVPLPRPSIAGILMSIPVNLSVAFIVKRTGSADRAAILLPMSLIIMVTFIAMFSGGFRSPMTWWLAAVPLFGAFLSGARGAVASALLSAGVLVMLFSAAMPASGGAPALGESPLVAQIRGQVTLLGLVTFIGWYYERLRAQRNRELVNAYTELEDAHRAIRTSQAYMLQITEHIGQAIWMEDREDDRVLYANRGFTTVWGLAREGLATAPRVWKEAVLLEDADLAPIEPDGRDHVYRIRTPEGEVRWIRHAVYPADDEAQQADPLGSSRVIHIAANITLKREAEALRDRFIETVIQAQETERRHLARELHDETGQSLTALLVGLKALDGRAGDDGTRSFIEQLRQQLRVVVSDIGRMSRGLHPTALDELGLVAAIRRLIDDARERHGLAATLHADGEELQGSLPVSVKLTAYRIAQEAITNVFKHAGASALDVSLSIDELGVHLVIEDDGRGFDVKNPKGTTSGSGLGMQSMRERAALVRGEVTIESAASRGTTIMADLPLREPTEFLIGTL